MLSFRRLINKESPLWAFLVGLAICAIGTALTSTRVLEPLESVFLDLRFRHRPPIEASPDIVHVDIDDDAIGALGPFPWPRSHHGALVRQLRDLGAKVVVLDLVFARKESARFVEERFVVAEEDQRLLDAVRSSGNVVVGYSMDLQQLGLSRKLWDALTGMAAVLKGNAAAGDEQLAQAGGLTIEEYIEAEGTLRPLALVRAVRERLDGNPALTFKDIRAMMLPDEGAYDSDLRALQRAYEAVRAEVALTRKATLGPESEGAPSTAGVIENAGWLDLIEATHASGHVNAVIDPDGILRRPPLLLERVGRVWPHAGLTAAKVWLESDGATQVTVERGAGGQYFFRARLHDEIKRDVLLRMDERGTVLVNWTSLNKPPDGFRRISYAGIYNLWSLRYRDLQGMLIRFYRGQPEEGHAALRQEYPIVFAEIPEEGDVDHVPAAAYDAGAADFPAEQMRCLQFMEESYLGIIEEHNALLSDPKYPYYDDIARERDELMRERDAIRTMRREVETRESEVRGYVQGKICFVGSNSTASGDLHSIPLSGTVAGVNTLSSITNMLLTDQFLVEASPTTNRFQVFLLGLLTSGICALTRPRNSLIATGLAVTGFLIASIGLFGVQGVVVAMAAPLLTMGATYGGVVTYREITEFRARRKLENELTGQTHAEIVRMVLEDPERLNKPNKVVGTVFFSDLAGFTGISEVMDSEHLTRFINRCHELVADHIVESKGYVDKFMGDGIMAVFGALVDDPDHAMKACTAALASVASIDELNRELKEQKLPSVSLRIGINTGEFTTAMVGSPTRRNFTAMGDAVNVGARFEPLNKMYGSTILVGPETHKAVADAFLTRELDLIRVKGRREPMPVHELICASAVAGQRRLQVQAYGEARAHFLARRWGDAIDAFNACIQKFGADGAASLYLTRSIAFNDRPPPDDWDGAFDMGFK